MLRKVILLSLVIGSTIAEAVLCFGIWQFTAFLEPELIHDKLMAIGDTREMTTMERWKIKLIWLPFALTLTACTGGQIALIRMSFQNPGDSERPDARQDTL